MSDASGELRADRDEPWPLSPSRLNLLVECPRCFWRLLRRDEHRPEGPFPSIVAGVEREVRERFDRHRDRGTLPAGLADAGLDARLLDDEDLLARCRTWQAEPTALDEESGTLLRGAVDDLLRRDDGSLLVLDYKSHGTPPEAVLPAYQRQLECYAHLLRANDFRVVDFGLLYYVHPTTRDDEVVLDQTVRWVPLRRRRPLALSRRAAEVLAGPPPASDPDCTFCDWRGSDET